MAVEYGSGRIVTDGLVLSLDAADRNSYPGSGNTWFDTSGNGRNYTLVGSPTFNSANGGSILFQNNQYSNGPASNSFGISQNVTVEIVIRINSILSGVNTQWGFLFYASGGADRGISCHINEGGQTLFDTMGYGNTNRISATAPSNGTINHFSFRYRDSGTPRKNIFRNAISVADSVSGIPTPLSLSSTAAQLPGNQYSIYMDGNIYLFRVYNRALSDDEILQNYNATKSRFGL